MTSSSSRPLVCCQACGTKHKLGDTVFSLLLGWWGLPWGVLMTPVQLVRNIHSLTRRTNPSVPSPALEKLLRQHMAAHGLDSARSEGKSV
ncbi:hypothetical protein [Paracidovorax konjaci]|uniref:Uncharacterized protein n=1 Tax=Paracidovorax konjaci TaxID=32040 RepID=A0A1I1WX00_9BURK|nr:hypothetical protein [Paracidovorax konjaci]SFD99657.1 hypothetical protein SAMN04489710_11169 [Paracidovorax konjaci]